MAGRRKGVQRVLGLMAAELTRTLRLLGARDVASLRAGAVSLRSDLTA